MISVKFEQYSIYSQFLFKTSSKHFVTLKLISNPKTLHICSLEFKECRKKVFFLIKAVFVQKNIFLCSFSIRNIVEKPLNFFLN